MFASNFPENFDDSTNCDPLAPTVIDFSSARPKIYGDCSDGVFKSSETMPKAIAAPSRAYKWTFLCHEGWLAVTVTAPPLQVTTFVATGLQQTFPSACTMFTPIRERFCGRAGEMLSCLKLFISSRTGYVHAIVTGFDLILNHPKIN